MDGLTDPPKLELSLTGLRGRPPQRFEIGAAGGWIGRGRDCEIQIDDPDRFISLKHARIDYAGGQFWLTDQSTNGTRLNNAATPIASGQRYPLHDGDHLHMGLFDLQVGTGPAAASSLDGAASPRAAPATRETDPLLQFASGPPAAGPSPSTGRDALGAPDPLASLLSDLTVQPSVPEGSLPPNDSGARFVGTASQLARRPASLPPAPAALPPTPVATPAATFATEAAATSPAKPPTDDVLNTMAAGIADLSPTLRPVLEPAPPSSPGDDPAQALALTPPRPARPIDPAAASLAAFWCGVGIIPRQLGPNDLIDVMAEFGMAFREATEGFSRLLGQSGLAGGTERNPLAAGHSGLRRHLEARDAGEMRLDEAVRDIFGRNEQRNRDYRDAVHAAVERMVQGLSARAIEQRFADMVRGRFTRSRQSELWSLFRAFEKELSQIARAQFQDDVEQRTRGEAPRPTRYAKDGFDL